MPDIVRVTVVPRFVSSLNITGENGYKLYKMTSGQSFETTSNSFGKVIIDSVSGKDLFTAMGIDVGTSWSTSNPDNQAFSFTFSGKTPLYIGYDTQRGLLLGGKIEAGNAGAYADIGLKLESNGSSSRNHMDADTYVTYSNGKTELTNSVRGGGSGGFNAFYRGSDGKTKVSNQSSMNPMAITFGGSSVWARCFLGNTDILMQDANLKKISEIKVGDIVACFKAENITKEFETRKVLKVFNNVTDIIIDLRGLFCTPGHHFLTCRENDSSTPRFDTISNILRADDFLVEQDGNVIRARTGARINTINDAVVAVTYRDHGTPDLDGVERRALVRTGIPIPAVTLADGLVCAPASTLAQHLEANAITLLSNGGLCSPDGTHHAVCKWPEGSTPFDTHEACNWIVQSDGQSYTPQWIHDLAEEDEHQGLRVVGSMPMPGDTFSIAQDSL